MRTFIIQLYAIILLSVIKREELGAAALTAKLQSSLIVFLWLIGTILNVAWFVREYVLDVGYFYNLMDLPGVIVILLLLLLSYLYVRYCVLGVDKKLLLEEMRGIYLWKKIFFKLFPVITMIYFFSSFYVFRML